MSDYRVAMGNNIALASLNTVKLQPASPGVRATRRLYMGNGSILEQGLYAEWIYNVVPDVGELYEVFYQMGLMAASYAPVTIYTTSQRYIYGRYNGMAIRPEANWENFFPRNITIIIRDLVVLP